VRSHDPEEEPMTRIMIFSMALLYISAVAVLGVAYLAAQVLPL
jgi:hypothetical protein